jgi:hypothetical protein
MREWTGRFAISMTLVVASARGQEAAAPRADEGPQSISELAPAAIPDDQNAAAQLEALAQQLDNWAGDEGRFSLTPLGIAYDQRKDRGEPPTEEEAAVMRQLVDQYAELAAGLARAATCEQYASRADFTKAPPQFMEAIMPRIQQFRAVGRFYAYQIKVSCWDDQHDEAVRQGIEALRLVRLHLNEPTMVAYLVTAAVEHTVIRELYDALATGRVSFEMHAALEAELALLDDPGRYHRMLLTERAYAKSAEAELGGPGGLANLLRVGPGNGAGQYLDAVVAASEGPWDVFRKEVRDDGKFGKPTGFGALADNLAPGVAASAAAHGRQIALLRCLRIFNALRLFAETKKREATGLEEIDLPAEAMRDPFGDGPLKARLEEDGWLIYSVMADEKDDGGDFREQKDYGLTPPGERRAE